MEEEEPENETIYISVCDEDDEFQQNREDVEEAGRSHLENTCV